MITEDPLYARISGPHDEIAQYLAMRTDHEHDL